MTASFSVLGPLAIIVDGVDVTPAGRLQAALLGLLIARAGESVADDAACELLWPGDADARSRLQLLVHRTRALLDRPERIERSGGGYRLRVDADELDADRFEQLASRGEHRAALALWRGEPFAGLDGLPFDAEREWWAERRHAVLTAALEAELRAGAPDAVVPELRGLAARHPLDERVAALLATALARSGRTDDALAAIAEVRRSLAEQLGLDPGAGLRELHRRILAGDELGAEPPTPVQLPPGGGILIGRDAELDALDRIDSAAGGGPCAIAITGMGGVGKTALALRWARSRRERYPDGILHAELRGFSEDEPLPPARVLTAFVRALGHQGAAPQQLEELTTLYRSLLEGRRMLLVLDNARDAEQVFPLLTGTPGCTVLVTSRDGLDRLVVHADAVPLRLAPLDAGEAVRLLRRLAGDGLDALDPADTAALAERCAALPLALRIVAQQLRTRDVPASAIVAELRERGERLDRLTGGGGDTDLRAVLSWSYDALGEEERRLFRRLGLLPGSGAPVEAVAALAGIDLRRTRRQLAALRTAHLVEEGADGRIGMHDLLREYAGELAHADDPEAVRSARSRLLRHYVAGVDAANAALEPHYSAAPSPAREPGDGDEELETPGPFADAEQATAWLERERPLILDLATSPDTVDDPHSVALILRYRSHLGVHGHLLDAERAFHSLLTRAVQSGDLGLECVATRVLGSFDIRAGRLSSGRARLERSLELGLEQGDEVGAAISLNNLGEIARLTGDAEAAVALYRRALELNRHRDDRERMGMNLANLGLAHGDLGDEAAADAAFDEGLALDGTDRMRASLFANLALSREARGDAAGAVSAAARGIELAHAIGDVEPKIWSQLVLGRCLAALGRAEEAESALVDAVDGARRVGSLPQLAPALDALAVLRRPSHPDSARALAAEAQWVATRLREG